MNSYNPDELYEMVAKELFLSRGKAQVTGGRNNIRAKGDGPEQAVRKLIGSLVGGQYRVTQGHVVRADGLKSGQMDIIVVKDVPAATMHMTEDGETELVRVEWVAAVGEVKASWSKHDSVIQSYCRVVQDMETLQEGLLVANKLRFGNITDNSPLADMTKPITGRKWNNRCYTFLLALGQGRCKVNQLSTDMQDNGIGPGYASVLILDEQETATLCIPTRVNSSGQTQIGVDAEVNLNSSDEAKTMSWNTIQEEGHEPIVSNARLLHYFVTDLQLHLGTWYDEYISAGHYARLGPNLRRWS